jgi:HPt (histidine-containing phosphotransfer) domain-containing protein
MTHRNASPEAIYSSFGADPDLGELVELFVRGIPLRVEQLLAGLQANNWSDVYRIAHQLKGAAGSYGFSQVTSYADCVESLVRQHEPEEQIKAAVDSLVAICRRMRAGAPEPTVHS